MMRSSIHKLRLVSVCAPVLLAAAACETSSSPAANGVPDAGPGFETDSSTPPVQLPEGGVDGPVTPPPLQGVTVTVTEDGVTKADVRVLGHDAAGTLNGDKKTDAMGKVSFALAPSMITVLTGASPNVAPVTFMAVADGDKLAVASKTPSVTGNQSPYAQRTATFTADPITLKGNGFLVTVGGSCANSGALVDVPVTVDLFPSCLGPKNSLLTAVTNNGTLTAYGFAKDLAIAMGSKGTVGPLTFAAPGTTTLTATNVPPQTGVFTQLTAIANGAGFDVQSQGGTVDAGGVLFSTATGFAEAYQPAVSIASFTATAAAFTGLVRREPTAAPATATLAFDLSTTLPYISTATLVSSSRPDVTFAADAPLTTTDGGVARIRWSTSMVSSNGGEWTFVLPPTATGFKVPALPSDASGYVPAGTITLADVTYFESSSLPGYAELKALPIQPSVGLDFVDSTRPLPVAGTLKVTRWSPPGQR
jgi:hypothetical protein